MSEEPRKPNAAERGLTEACAFFRECLALGGVPLIGHLLGGFESIQRQFAEQRQQIADLESHIASLHADLRGGR